MIYREFQQDKLSLLGFGMMRLPLSDDGSVDEEQVFRMVDHAMANGVNYFDTAFPYHNGKSELVAGKALGRYPRERYYLASKYPGHQIAKEYHPEEIFEKQLKKCGVEYFDYYLLHNVHEISIDVYEDPQWGIIDYFVKQKEAGRIRHLGFSTHARPETLEAFLERHGDRMEFCQIQLNYLDWTLQEGKKKVELLNRYNIPIWVMESVRGGRLCDLGEKNNARLAQMAPGQSPASWGYRYLMDIPGVTMILTGASNIEQMRENVETFAQGRPLTKEEKDLLYEIAEDLKGAVGCTACRYCTEGCPAGLDIPLLIKFYNDAKFDAGMNVSMQMDSLAKEKQPDACIKCGACAAVCPQKIPVPEVLEQLAELRKSMPDWGEICKKRAAIAAAEDE